MPRMTSDPVVRKSISVPEEIWKRIERLIEISGFSEAEQLRRLVVAGLPQEEDLAVKQTLYEDKLLAMENRKLVNQKMRLRMGNMEAKLRLLRDQADKGSESLIDELIGYLKD